MEREVEDLERTGVYYFGENIDDDIVREAINYAFTSVGNKNVFEVMSKTREILVSKGYSIPFRAKYYMVKGAIERRL